MLREHLRGYGEETDLLFAVRRHRPDFRHLGRSERQGPGLVKGYVRHPGQALQRVAFPNEKSVLRRVSDGRHDGRRRCQDESAGTEDDNHGHGPEDLAGDDPCDEGGRQRADNDPRRPAVGQPHDLRLSRVGGLHQPDHPLDGAVLSDSLRPHVEGAELIHRSAADLIAFRFVRGDRLPGHHGLVDRRPSEDDDAVHRNGLPREDADHVPYPYLVHGNELLPGLRDPPRRLRRQ